MTEPLRCRLRVHDWEQRQNPETRELYEVCLRCDTYRDRGRAVPGAGAAGAAGANAGGFVCEVRHGAAAERARARSTRLGPGDRT